MSVAGSARIPLVDLGAQYQTIRDEVMPAIEAVIERSAFIHGPFVAAFEREMAEFARASHCIGSANGTEAIFVALKALGAGRATRSSRSPTRSRRPPRRSSGRARARSSSTSTPRTT